MSGGFHCVELRQRALISLVGIDSLNLLQGCLTNDTNRLSPHNAVIYSAALNEQGRLNYDLIIYRLNEEAKMEVLVECHQSSVGELIKWLSKYRLRKKVQIEVDCRRKIFALFHPDVVTIPPVGTKRQSHPVNLATPELSKLRCLR